jgi:ribulose-bisphosphate carboxylase large chain
MLRRAEYVEDHGGRYMMVDILTCGWSALQTVRNRGFGLVLHAHRAGHAAFTRLADHGINMRVIAKVARVIGVDQLHVGTAVGKMSETREEVRENISALTEPMHGLRGIHGHPKGTVAGAMAMRQAMGAVMEGRELMDYAEEHEELALALRIWSAG